MSEYRRMIIFVLVLGVFTSALLMGVQALTAERIERAAEAHLQTTILDAHDVNYTAANFLEVFEAEIEIRELEGLSFYVHTESGGVSILFFGFGVWGPIEGVLSLEPDFETIRDVAVLDQEETPGLGAVITNPDYQALYVGKSMYPELNVIHDADPDDPNEVDAIAGATRTSEAFDTMLNNAYQEHREVWMAHHD